MKKLASLFLALLMSVVVVNGAYCAEGDEFSTTSFRIDGNGEMYFQALNEVAATNDTITAAESGKVFHMMGATNVVMTLPASDEGLWFDFINGNTTTFQVNPNGTDRLVFASLDAGDQLQAPGTIGARITVSASEDTTWFVTTGVGTYVDVAQ